MDIREQRAAEAAKHIATMKTVFSTEVRRSAEGAHIYEEGEGRELELPEAPYESTTVTVVRESAVDAVYAAKGAVTVLDFASFTKPGGNYEAGAWGREEVLCSESILYPVLVALKDDYYEKNRGYARGLLYTDRAMLVPEVKFTRNGKMRDADVIVISAPNRTRALENNRSAEECDADLARRIEAIMRIAATSGCETLVLGDFGCGFAGNPAEQVATLFKDWIDTHPGAFSDVVFAIPGGPSLETFQDVLGAPEPVVEAVVEADGGEDDEDDIYGMDLPEGITLR